ncbi:MAG: hypothetical protein J6A58_10240 [Oscillospiraceae bacterium]|nr:hypothetical protein [Oscillospiraceae bacterium]
MKFNKKIAAYLLAAACTASAFGVAAISPASQKTVEINTVSAASDFTISASSADVKAGETFKIDINLENVPASGVAGLDFAIKYDSKVMEVTKVTEGSASTNDSVQVEGLSSNLYTNIAAGEVSVLWATGQLKTTDTWIKSDGVLLTLECKAVADGSTSVEITKASRAGATSVDAAVENLAVINPSVVAGKVTVGAGSSAGDNMYGDVDLNGTIDLTDLTLIALHLLGDTNLQGQALENADVIVDGKLGLDDLATMKQYIVKDPDVVLGLKK